MTNSCTVCFSSWERLLKTSREMFSRAVPNIGTDAEPALHRSRGPLVRQGEAQTRLRNSASDAEHALDVAVDTAIGGDDRDAGTGPHAGEESEEHEFMAIDHSRVALRGVLGKVNAKALPLLL